MTEFFRNGIKNDAEFTHEEMEVFRDLELQLLKEVFGEEVPDDTESEIKNFEDLARFIHEHVLENKELLNIFKKNRKKAIEQLIGAIRKFL